MNYNIRIYRKISILTVEVYGNTRTILTHAASNPQINLWLIHKVHSTIWLNLFNIRRIDWKVSPFQGFESNPIEK